MPHIHWVARQNKVEIPKEEDEVNTRKNHERDGQAHDPDTMVVPLYRYANCILETKA